MNAKAADRRRQIIDSATDLFGRDGYKRVTMKQLAQACAVTEAALYKHFSSKAEIYTAVLESLEARLANERVFEVLSDVDDVERILRGLAEHILSFFGKNEDMYRLLLYSALEGHERARHVFNIIRGRYIKFLKTRLDELYESGHVVEKNNEITARCFTGMVFDCALGFSLFKGMQGRMYEPTTVVNNNIPIYVNGLKKTLPSREGFGDPPGTRKERAYAKHHPTQSGSRDDRCHGAGVRLAIRRNSCGAAAARCG